MAYDFLADMNDGEKQLYDKCSQFQSDEFKIIPNALFDRVGDGTNQIDLIAITKKGIFVIEMKDYKGWISGDENHKYWSQSLNYGRKKIKFRNPIKQNENHIKTIKSMLSENLLDNFPIYNVIVFGEKAERIEITASVDVIKIANVDSVFEKYKDIAISNQEISNLYNFFDEKNIKDEISRKKHLSFIKRINAGKEEASNFQSTYTYNEKNVTLPIDKIQYQFNYKAIILGLVALFVMFFIKKGYYLVGAGIFIVLGIKFSARKAMGFGILLGVVFFALNPLFNMSNNSEKINNSNPKTTINSVKPKTLEPKQTLNQEVKKDINLPITNKASEPAKEVKPTEKIEVTEKLEATEKNIGQVINKTIFLQSTEKEVEELLGKPVKIYIEGKFTKWMYGLGHVSFDQEGRVNGWYNYNNVLASAMRKKEENAPPMDIGSSREDVLKALGSPSKIESNNKYLWMYGLGHVSFDQEGRVNGWYNYNNVLASGMRKKEENAQHIEIGSSREDVLKALGSPSEINSSNIYLWMYGLGRVTFDQEGRVNGWYNYNNVLASAMRKKEENAQPIDIGSSREDVLKALGSPSKIESNNKYLWMYGLGHVSFDQEWKVKYWKK